MFRSFLLSATLLLAAALPTAMTAHNGHDHSGITPVKVNPAHVDRSTPWAGKRVAFLGDSMTDPTNASSHSKYWHYLDSLTGIRPEVFARSGFRWDGIYRKAQELSQAIPADSLDAIFIWASTNDFNGAVPPGSLFTETVDSVSVGGTMTARRHRLLSMADSTVCGNINRTLSFLKSVYPSQLIVVMTPIHRGYARFTERNEQLSEEWANGIGLYLDLYVLLIRRAAELWSVPVIDLFAESGIVPALDSNIPYIHNPDSDRLHLSDEGNYRIARIIQSRLSAFPVP